jgi:two-component system OmpR family sensor kinase
VRCALACTALHGRAAVACTIVDEASGPGLEQLLGLFDRFARSSPIRDGEDEAQPVRSNSIGLGLAVAHTVVTRHDGVIDCQGRDGRAVFTLALPLCVTGPAPPDACPVA